VPARQTWEATAAKSNYGISAIVVDISETTSARISNAVSCRHHRSMLTPHTHMHPPTHTQTFTCIHAEQLDTHATGQVHLYCILKVHWSPNSLQRCEQGNRGHNNVLSMTVLTENKHSKSPGKSCQTASSIRFMKDD
jgi:hypothetical protein